MADRLFLVLETLAETGPAALADLCRHLELNKSTVHRLLSSLIYMGYVKQDAETGKYALSFKLLTLSNKLMSHMDILETVRPFLKKLSEETGETVHFVQLDGLDAVYIYKEESYQNSIRMVSKVGSRFPFTVPVWEKPWPRHAGNPNQRNLGQQPNPETDTSYYDSLYPIFRENKRGSAKRICLR